MLKTLKKLILNDNAERIGGTPNLQGVNPLGRVPNVGREDFRRGNKKINRYLEYQEKRLYKHLETKNYEAIVIIFLILLKNSISYQTLLYHRTKSNWYYRKSRQEIWKEYQDVVNKLRSFDMTLYLNRFYVIKNKMDSERQGQRYDSVTNPLKEGEKLRPIGSPDIGSAVISKAFTNILTFMFEDTRGIAQHGYRPNKGVYSVLVDVINTYMQNKDIYIMEYDFKSFFNKVSLHWVRYKIEEKSKTLSNLVGSMLLKIEYIFKDLEKENELSFYGFKSQKNGKLIPLILRSGLPQGLSMSPLLSTLAMEFVPEHKGNKMYADDGLFMDNDPEEFYFYMESLGGYGVSIEDSKTRMVDKSKEIKFLGCYIHFKEEYIRYNEHSIKFDDPKLEQFLKTVASYYGKQPYRWEWEIEPDSYIESFRINWKDLPILDLILTYLFALWDWSSYKGVRYISGKGFYDIIHSSTYCINRLLDESTGMPFKKKRPIKIPVFTDLSQDEVKKQNYLETFYDVNTIVGTNNWSEHIELLNLVKRKMELEKN
jgi:hypothetical protein